MNTAETITALCTGVGGAISIIRISGDNSLNIIAPIWKCAQKLNQHPRKLLLGKIKLENSSEPAMAVYMPEPNSYTGENVVELHCHGGLMNSRAVLEATVNAGARLADPGEFTYRAFINGKMDLTQAEAVADLISAHSNMALHLAERQISGKLSSEIGDIYNILVDISAECESRMDFVDEDLDWTSPHELIKKIDRVSSRIQKLLDSRTEGIVLRNGIRVVIAGKPNTGKSSLMNLLLGFDRAIVTPLPGTTRDTLEEFANVRNIPTKLIDTAGIREADDIIENFGVERSLNSVKQAQIILWLLDSTNEDYQEEIKTMKQHVGEKKNVIAIWNKIDSIKHSSLPPKTKFPTAFISVTKEKQIDQLLDLFEKTVWGFPHAEEPETAVSSRHAVLLEKSISALTELKSNLDTVKWELASVNLRTTTASLGEILGKNVSPDILENIFSRFCIGK